MCRNAADTLIGATKAIRSQSAWRQTYRALDHGYAKSQCKDLVGKGFPQAVEDFGNLFYQMQSSRHEADYDPYPGTTLTRSEVLTQIDAVEAAIKAFRKAPIKDRRAFAAWVLMKQRR